ncbi:MAG: hypothetical protein KF900_00240 [Bacteroidetes bacterium]|nr:hypothetical protein [Bacteroidota bacterium]
MVQIPEIQLLAGFCSLPFGASKEQALQIFGQPEEEQNISEELLNNQSLVLHYWDKGFSLFFDLNRNEKFCSVETDNRETVLFDAKIFTLKEKEIIALMKQNNFSVTDTEVHPWGEKRVSFDEAGLDCYFENNRLVSVNFSSLEFGEQYPFFLN